MRALKKEKRTIINSIKSICNRLEKTKDKKRKSGYQNKKDISKK